MKRVLNGEIVKIQENQKSKAVKEFSRFAHEYNSYNVIQAEVAKSLVKKIHGGEYGSIIDIGCGSGEVYKNIVKYSYRFEHFIALDSSEEMLKLHPSGKNIEKICADFNTLQTFEHLFLEDNSLVLSSSALQWSKNLDFTLFQISRKSTNANFAIFTSDTFKTLHKTAQVDSPIYSSSILKETILKYYQATFELKEYKLFFESVREMFNYIKKSGVSGGEKQLSYKQTKNLMKYYPLKYLEFEVLFVEAKREV